ncbi:class I SAM-dependent methyltransferase [Nafulsella turpanensis]|uniref:class I SAM-dependent methyltransferase n=1 Tax=Nafulsella turpanensis TaxID=1265690 RepID=UPI00034DDD21|nr:class I SAM-dependent methyltransferase [Nafulsella turpanensis]
MQDYWNKQYETDDYYFGKEPNEFFRTFIDSLPAGKILLPAAGEGRNAVYAAEVGWEVEAFDTSPKAREKALKLARERDTNLRYELQDAQSYNGPKDYFDVIAIVFLHLPAAERRAFHQKMVSCLNPNGGNLYLLAFSDEQLGQAGPGPADNSLLYSKQDIIADFKDLQIDMVQEEEVNLKEGVGHRGKAKVIKLSALRHQHEQASDTFTI